jgi:exonuclease VII small subunit
MEDQNSYSRLKSRLEDIVVQVRSKDISLEKSLDLYEEALRIGGRCVEQIDRTNFTAEELEASEFELKAADEVGTQAASETETQTGDAVKADASAKAGTEATAANTATTAATTMENGEQLEGNG